MVRNLYVMSDTHDDLEAVRRALDYAEAEGLENSRIIHAGDLSLRPYTKDSLDRLVESKDISDFLSEKRAHNEGILKGYNELFESSGMPFTVIPGNYDGNLRKIFGENDIHNRSIEIGGIKMVGYGAGGNLDEEWIGPGHIQLLLQMGEIELFKSDDLRNLLERNHPDIAVIHNPPYGFCDDMFNGQHVGTPTSTKYMQHNDGLKLILSGHIHEAGPNGNNPNGVRGIARIERESGEGTIIINPGNLGRFDLIDSRTLENARTFDYGTFARVDVEDDGTPIKVIQYSVQEKGKTIGEVRILNEVNLN
jgi:Icc-related predicted phosphoesterase